MVQDYANVLQETEQQRQQIQNREQSQSREPSSREQVRGKLANSLGTVSEAASSTGISEQAAHEIVSRAFRNAW
jgi:hypothetical protein